MQIDFQALEQALAPIEQIGQAELTFDAGPTTITLRVLRPEEEVEAQKYAADVLRDQEETGDHQAVSYLDKLRLGFLSYSVVAIGDMDFRNVEYVDTGDKLPNGTSIKVTKAKAMRELLSRWSRPVLTAVFGQFHVLTAKAEAEAERLIEYEPSNIPAEIERLNKRVQELREMKESAEQEEKTKLSERLNAVDEALKAEPQIVPSPEAVEDDDDEVKVNPEQVMPTSQRQPVRRQGPITPATVQGVPEGATQPPAREPGQPSQAQQSASAQAQPPRSDESLVNTDDADTLHAAADAEHARLMARRRAHQVPGAAQVNTDNSALTAAGFHSGAPRAPHLDAASVASNIPVVTPATHKQPVGTLDGKDVYRLPGQELGTSNPQRPDSSVLNPQSTPGGGSRNPRFNPPKKP